MRGMTLHHRMRARALLVITTVSVMLACFAFTTSRVYGATTVPATINFQGRLLDATGAPVSDGLYNMKFALYDAASAGTLKWSETRETTSRVQVTDGLFTAKLGEGSNTFGGSLATVVPANGTLYFDITQATPATATCSTSSCATWESPMTPRHQLSTSAYAFNADTIDGVDGAALAQLSANNTFTGANTVNVASSSALAIVNGATNLFKADTSGSQVVIGQADATAAVLVLDSSSGADPSNVAGSMYYNSTSGKFRCYQGGWTDCITAAGGATLQSAYDASGSPATITTTAAKGVKIVTGAAPTADIFSVDTSANPVVTNNINGIDVNYAGGAAAVEGSAVRLDVTPGTTTGGTWSGLRVVTDATGAAAGVNEYGVKLEGPVTPGAGQETGMYIGTGWDTGLDVQSGGLNLAAYTAGGVPSDPGTPAAGNLRVYAKTVAGRVMLKWRAPSGVDTSLQPSLAFNTIWLWTPATGKTATGTGFGNTWPAATGTVTHPTVANTNLGTSVKTMQLTNVATTTNQILGLTSSTATLANVWRGNASGLGGFFMQTRFKTTLVPAATHRIFVGLSSMTTGASAADTITGDTAGLSHITTDNITTMAFMTRNNATTTRATFTVPTIASGNIYDFTMYAPPNGSSIYYRLVDLATGSVLVDSSTTATLPRNTIFMGPQVQMSNGTANITVGTTAIGINKIYLETDN